MSSSSNESAVTIVDSEASLVTLLDSISELATKPPSLYVNLEGAGLGRHGSISILSLYVSPTDKTYLIDIQTLGTAAFSTVASNGTSLKTVLESSVIPKVVFDIRKASDALFSLFEISIDGIKEIQLMELGSRAGSRKFAFDLGNCIKNDSPNSAAAKAEWRLCKDRRNGLWEADEGDRSKELNERPMLSEIVHHCKQYVTLLPPLYGIYNAKLAEPGETFWRVHIREATKTRIKGTQGSNHDGKLHRNDLEWDRETLEDDIDSWNDEIMMEAQLGEIMLNEDDEWVDAPNLDFDDLDFWNEDEYEEPENDWDDEPDTARDCVGWEEDMVKNGEYF